MIKNKPNSTNDFISFVAATPANPKFYADTGHWYLSKGIVGINNVSLIVTKEKGYGC